VKRTFSVICAFLLGLSLLFSFASPGAEAAQNTGTRPARSSQQQKNYKAPLPPFDASACVLDDADKLSPSDLARLQARLREIQAQRKIGVGIIILKNLAGRAPRATAREYLNNSGYNNSPNGGTLLLLSMRDRQWYFVTDKKMQQVLVDKFVTKKIEKGLVPHMKKGQVADACEVYLDIVDEYTGHYLETGSAYSDSNPPPEDRLFLMLFGLGASIFGAFAAKYKLRMDMSNVAPAIDANAYMRQESLSINRISDEFLYVSVTRTEISRSKDNDDSSSSSNDGGGGGGGSW